MSRSLCWRVLSKGCGAGGIVVVFDYAEAHKSTESKLTEEIWEEIITSDSHQLCVLWVLSSLYTKNVNGYRCMLKGVGFEGGSVRRFSFTILSEEGATVIMKHRSIAKGNE